MVGLLGAVQNNDTSSSTTTRATRIPSLTATTTTTSDKKEKKKQLSSSARTVLPFLRVKWSSKQQSNQQKISSETTNRTEYETNTNKTTSISHGLPTRRVALSQSPPPPSSGNRTKNNATDTAILATNNNNSSNTTTNTIMNRTHTTPIPVAESILRSIYDQASESAKEMAVTWSGPVVEMPLWNTSQFFPTAIPGITTTTTTTGNQSLLAIADKKSTTTAVITVEDLERILQEKGFIRQSDVVEALQKASLDGTRATNAPLDSSTKPQKNLIEGMGQPVGDLLGGTAATAPMPPSKSTSSSQVAFPQPSVLSYRSLKWGVTAASFFTCTVLATSVLPSLWLMGGLVGSLYGYQTGKRLADGTVPDSFFPSFLIMFGRRITKSYLQVYDMVTALFFMYKTGQLSYSMWRKYADLDGRYKIQDKIDAWNAVFIEGKENFDRWEKENEVGRKVLATVRTIWLVEERSLKKKGLKRVRKRSRYRVIQVIYDGAYFTGRFVASLWRLISGGGTSLELSEFLRGIRLDISKAQIDTIGRRIGAVMAALVGVNIAGALYTLSPGFLMLLAIAAGLVWPTWFPELIDRCRRLAEETRARGRGENGQEEALSARGVDKSRYHYYVNRDGKKKYYRVTQTSRLRKRQKSEQKRFRWPWQKPEEPERRSFLDFLQSR
eukprot:scaffold2954_cov171-Amphora_coffeaeformis.AAC.8